MKHLYQLNKIDFSYTMSVKNKIKALKDLSLEIASGDFVCLAGPSGSGKTTLLNLLGMIERPQNGTLLFEGEDLTNIPEKRLNGVRRSQLGFIFQDFHLIDTLTAFENVEYFLISQKISKSERTERVKQALESVGLTAHANKRPNQLSGGQKQRVAVARALAKQPKVIIGDEPTASLDQATGREIIDLLLELNSSKGISIILSSHDPMVIKAGPKVIRLVDGQIKAVE